MTGTQTQSGQAPTTMIRLDHCAKHYGSVVALAEVELEVHKGEFVTLLGPSGSGKTTMLNLIAGMVGPTSGRVFIGGKDATKLAVNERGLGMVFQNYALMPHMTIFENVAFPLRVRKVANEEVRKRVTEVLDLVHLPQVAKRKPRELSGGQQQRVALARAIVYNPNLILMDEPLGALDKKLREQMQLEIKRLHTELGITMLYVTHDQEEALTMSDRIVLLNAGRIEQMGPPDDLYFKPRSVFAADFLGDSNMMDGRVESTGETVQVATATGQALRAKADEPWQTGASVKVMVRPENVRVLRDGAADQDNVVAGKLIDSILLGGVVKHYVRLDDETTLVAQELNRPLRGGIRPGQPVRLGWRADDLRVLPAEGQLPEA